MFLNNLDPQKKKRDIFASKYTIFVGKHTNRFSLNLKLPLKLKKMAGNYWSPVVICSCVFIKSYTYKHC